MNAKRTITGAALAAAAAGLIMTTAVGTVFWKAVESKMDPPRLAAAPQAVHWIVWRPRLATFFRSLEPDEKRALDAVTQGASFDLVCEALAEAIEPSEVPTRAAQLLRRWTEEGLIAGVRFGDGLDSPSIDDGQRALEACSGALREFDAGRCGGASS